MSKCLNNSSHTGHECFELTKIWSLSATNLLSYDRVVACIEDIGISLNRNADQKTFAIRNAEVAFRPRHPGFTLLVKDAVIDQAQEGTTSRDFSSFATGGTRSSFDWRRLMPPFLVGMIHIIYSLENVLKWNCRCFIFYELGICPYITGSTPNVTQNQTLFIKLKWTASRKSENSTFIIFVFQVSQWPSSVETPGTFRRWTWAS